MKIALYSLAPFGDACSTLRVLGPAKLCHLEVVNGAEGGVSSQFLQSIDLIVVQRDFPRKVSDYRAIVDFARTAAIPLVFEIDDLLTRVPAGYRASEGYYYATAMLPMLEAIFEADLVTTSTRLLREYCLQFNSNVCLLPNYLNDTIWSLHSQNNTTENRPVIVGYMGGASHADDLVKLVPVIQRLCCKYGSQIVFRFWGCKPPNEIRLQKQVEWIPMKLSAYSEFGARFSNARSDIFIAPLLHSENSKCKSAIKFLEYSSGGKPGVYEQIEPYSSVISHGYNGFMARNEEEWFESIDRLVADPEMRRQMGKSAQQSIVQDWLLSSHCDKWKEAYESAIKSSTVPAPTRNEKRNAFYEEALRIGYQLTACISSKNRDLIDLEEKYGKLGELVKATAKFRKHFGLGRWKSYLMKNYRKLRYNI
ncbi:glycosyltransferase [Pseudomonadota bacterium]